MDIYEFLAGHSIGYERYDHPPVFTCEQARQLDPSVTGLPTKNLFLRDKPGRRHFLVVVADKKRVDLKSLAAGLGVSRLSLGSAQRLQKHLGIDAGAVSLLALVNDIDRAVEVILDEDVRQAEAIRCHPLVNTSTLVISRAGIEQVLKTTGHNYKVMAVPETAGDVNSLERA